MVEIKKLFISNNDIKLEAEFFRSNSHQTIAVLLLHPHPMYGGNMYNNVVSGVFNKFIINNVSTLIFNFRAVGNSSGNHSNGEGELSDVKACIDFLISQKKFDELLIVGYSYGAAIGCSAINYSNCIIGYIAIAFPWDFMGAKYKEFSQSTKPKLFIQGDRDNVARYDKYLSHFKYYHDPKDYVISQGADH